GQILDRDALLFHRIALAQRDRVAERGIFFAECFEIDRDAERSPDFVLAPITAADRPRFIVKNEHVRPEKIYNLFRFRHEWLLVFQERENSALYRRDPRMDTQPHSR